jgi:hypothetical protein
MARGRPPKGLAHVDSLEGDEGVKAQLKTILATLTGELTVGRAAARLGVSESRFHELRRKALLGMMAGLAPRSPGRPPSPKDTDEVADLKERVAWFEEELEISRLRTEIALWKPWILRDPVSVPPWEKKGSSPKGARRKPKPGGRSDT